MNSSFLESNLSFITKYNPELAEKIRNHNNINSTFELAESKSSEVVLIKDGLAMHDMIDPSQEAIDIFQAIEKNQKKSINIIYGLGLGYLPQRFAKNAKGKIIVYENNLDILRITLELADLSKELSRKDLVIAHTIDDIEQAYKKFFYIDYTMSLSFLNYHRAHFVDEINYFIEKISSLHNIYQSNYKNLFWRSGSWTYSVLTSAYFTSMRNSLEVLKDKFKGKTAVVISAGPSLDKNIDLIKKHRENVAVFCVGTALKKVLKHNITPDFVVLVDCVKSAFDQVKNFDLSEMNLIIQPMTFKDVHNIKTKNTYYFYPKNDNTTNWLASLWGINSSYFQNKGTVSLCAFNSAEFMGFENIILIGQDLAYTNGQCYAQGSAYGDLRCAINKENPTQSKVSLKTSDIDGFDSKGIVSNHNKNGKEVIAVKGQIEDIVYAPADYALFIKYFEEAASEKSPNINIINATEGGAYIEGFDHITFSEALEKYANKNCDVSLIIEKISPIGQKETNRRRNLINNKLVDFMNIYKKTMPLFEQGYALSKDFGYRFRDEDDFSLVEEAPEKVKYYYETLKDLYLRIEKQLSREYIFNNLVIIQKMGVEDAFSNFDAEDDDSIDYLLYSLFSYFRFGRMYMVRINMAHNEYKEDSKRFSQ